MSIGVSHDIESVIGAALETDPGGTKYIFGMDIFSDVSHDTKCVIG